MTNETPFIETPEVPLALQSNPMQSGVFVDKLDFYNPTIVQPNLNFDSGSSTIKGDPIADSIAKSYNSRLNNYSKQPWAVYGDINKPIQTSLTQTLRYNDDALGGYRVNDNTQEYRYGNNQGFLDSVKTRAMQFGGNFASTMLGSFLDIPTLISSTYNFASDLAQGKDGKQSAIDAYRGLFDNSATGALDELNKWFQEGNETYDTRDSEANPITSGKIIGDIVASSGFALGGITGMLLEDAVVGLATGGAALAPLLAAQLATGYKAIKLLHSGEEAAMTLKTALKAARGANEGLSNAYQVAKIQKGLLGLNMYTNNMFESSVEAKQAQESTEQNLTSKFQEKYGRAPNLQELTEIKKTANEAGNYTFFGNMALLALTNKIEFGDIIKRMQIGKEAFDYTERGLVKLAAEGLDNVKVVNKVAEAATPSTGKYGKYIDKTKDVLSKSGVMARSSFGEMIEEGGQFAVSNSAEEYHTLKYNKNGLTSADDVVKSMLSAVGKTVSTEEGWLNMLAGLGGGMVIGGLRKLAKLDPENTAPNHDEIVNNLTETKLSDILQGIGTKLEQHVNSVSINNKNNTVKSFYESEANKHASLFNWTISALKGKNNYYDIRKDQINNAKDLEGDDFKNTFGVEYNETNKKNVHEYLDNVLKEVETIKDVNEKVQAVYKNPYGFSKNPKIEDLVNYATYETYKKELVYQLSKQKFNEKIAGDLSSQAMLLNDNISGELLDKLSTLSGYDLVRGSEKDLESNRFADKKGNKEGILAVRKELVDEIKRLQALVDDNIASDSDKSELKSLSNLVNKSDKAIVSLNTKTPSDEAHAEFVEEYLNYTFDKRNITNKPNRADINQLIALGTEKAKVKASSERSLKLFNLLASKKGFEKFKDMELAVQNRFIKGLAQQDESTSDDDGTEPRMATESDRKIVFQTIADILDDNINLSEKQQKIYDKYKTEIDALRGRKAGETIGDDEFNNFINKGLPGVLETTLERIVDKIVNGQKLTDREEQVFTDSRVTAEINERLRKRKEADDAKKKNPITDPYTGFKEGDILKSTVTKDTFIIKQLDGKHYHLVRPDGTITKWSYAHAHTYFDYGKFNLTGSNIDYTQAEVASIQGKFTNAEIVKIATSNGGYKLASDPKADPIYEQVFVVDDKGKGFLLTRKGIIALLDIHKKRPTKKKKKPTNYIYAGRQKDKTDLRTPIQMAEGMGLVDNGDDEIEVGFAEVLKAIINSPYATASEQELARFMIVRVGPDVKITFNKTESYFSTSKGIHIDYSNDGFLSDTPIENVIIHEAMHYFTHDSLKNDAAFAAKIKQIYDYVKEFTENNNKGEFRGTEETVNPLDEFIAEAFTNPEFMRLLASLNEGTDLGNRNLWERFIDAVSSIFGLDAKKSILDYMSYSVFTQIDKINAEIVYSGNASGMNFNPNIVFNQMMANAANLQTLKGYGKYNTESFFNEGTFKTVKAEGKPATPGFHNYLIKKEGEKDKPFPRIVFQYATDEVTEVRVGGIQVGRFAAISRFYYLNNKGERVPLHQITREEYEDVTGNLASTYEQFVDIVKTHYNLERHIVEKSKDKEVPISQFKNMMDINTMKGNLDIILNENLRPAAMDLYQAFPKFQGQSMPVILSLSKQFNPNTGGYEDRPAFVSSEIPADTKVRKLIDSAIKKNESKLRGLNARYFTVVSTTGKWDTEDDVEFIISHPRRLPENKREAFVQQLKALVADPNSKPSDFSFDGFIKDPYGSKREIKLIVAKGELVLYSKFPNDKKATFSKGMTADEINGIKDFEDFVKLLNVKLAERKLPIITTEDFREDLMDDGVASTVQLAKGLQVVTSTKIRNPYVTFMGNNTVPIIKAPQPTITSTTIGTKPPVTQGAFSLFGDDGSGEDEQFDPFADDDVADDESIEQGQATSTTPPSGKSAGSMKSAANKKKGMGGFKKYERPNPLPSLIEEYKRKCL